MFNRVQNLISELQNLDKLKPQLKIAFQIVLDVVKNGGTIYTAGNGGSAAEASHLTGEFVAKYKEIRKPIKSICLNSDSTLLTCLANDFKYKNIFARQIECFGSPKDVLILFTTSGNSKNLIHCIDEGIKKGIKIIIFNGKDGGIIHKIYKDSISEILIPNLDGSIIQEIQLHLIHELVEYIEKNI